MTGWTRRDLGEYKTGQHLKKSQTEPKLSRQEHRWSTEYFPSIYVSSNYSKQNKYISFLRKLIKQGM